jgi:hypothetical protein
MSRGISDLFTPFRRVTQKIAIIRLRLATGSRFGDEDDELKHQAFCVKKAGTVADRAARPGGFDVV